MRSEVAVPARVLSLENASAQCSAFRLGSPAQLLSCAGKRMLVANDARHSRAFHAPKVSRKSEADETEAPKGCELWMDQLRRVQAPARRRQAEPRRDKERRSGESGQMKP